MTIRDGSRLHPAGAIRVRHVGAVFGRVDDARQYGVDGDVLAGKFGGEAFRKPMDGAFGRRVGARPGGSDYGTARANMTIRASETLVS